ncbi:HNH endonuclease [Rhodoferax koreense]|uniref:HNH endonuclease n=1 Tax=Rhodoferax koreensis TaxID=1842727 RepID=A0A1P8JV57_9BURK|nr:HNH endonuclease [Rhodoferax koreense]
MRRLQFMIALLSCHAVGMAALPRDRAEVRAFIKEHPCPATGRTRGACPGYQVDHTIPLCAGGPDKRENMFWLSVEDHKFKTFTDVRECRKLRQMARTPAK